MKETLQRSKVEQMIQMVMATDPLAHNNSYPTIEQTNLYRNRLGKVSNSVSNASYQ